jgi:hypothetical protein
MKLLAPTGYARLPDTKAATKYAARRIEEGCDVTMHRDSDGMIRVDFKPSENGDGK